MENHMRKGKAVVRVAQSKGPKERLRGPAHKIVVPNLWVPKVGSNLVVELPGERLVTQVARVVNPDTVIVKLVGMPLCTKTHFYDKGAFVPCERVKTPLETVWRAFRPIVAPPPKTEPKTRKRRKKVAA